MSAYSVFLHVDETARADEDQKLCPQHLLQTHPSVVELQTFLWHLNCEIFLSFPAVQILLLSYKKYVFNSQINSDISVVTILPRDCRRTAAGLPPYCRRTAAALPPYCRRTAAVLPPYCRRTAAVLPPYCRRNSDVWPFMRFQFMFKKFKLQCK